MKNLLRAGVLPLALLAAALPYSVAAQASDAVGKALPIKMVTQAGTAAPPSFAGDMTLYTFNLFIMTAMFFLSMMLAGRQAGRIWAQRDHDHILQPVSLYRLVTLFAALASTLRCGAEAMMLWGWNPADPIMTARVIMAKRWIDPVALLCGVTWMAIVMLGEPGVEHQLRKGPLAIDPWSRWPVLVRSMGVIALSLVAALAAVTLR
jgi:hypothetical protein